MSVEEHRARGDKLDALRVAVITVSDTRTLETDASGKAIVETLEKAGHHVADRTIVRDEPAEVRRTLERWLAQKIDGVVLNGGTGIAPRDGTVEVVEALLDRALPGFGELFRYLSYQEIGAAAMLSRATGGIARGKAVFSLPGSTKAVRLAMEKLIIPELRHLVAQARGG
jgi:molybdenum cofactor biosynthesis protein B